MTLNPEHFKQKSSDNHLLFCIPMETQPVVSKGGTDGHGCWDCNDGKWGWWGREQDGFHRLHSSLHQCPFGKAGEQVSFDDANYIVHSIDIDYTDSVYNWCIWIKQPST